MACKKGLHTLQLRVTYPNTAECTCEECRAKKYRPSTFVRRKQRRPPVPCNIMSRKVYNEQQTLRNLNYIKAIISEPHPLPADDRLHEASWRTAQQIPIAFCLHQNRFLKRSFSAVASCEWTKSSLQAPWTTCHRKLSRAVHTRPKYLLLS